MDGMIIHHGDTEARRQKEAIGKEIALELFSVPPW
jgi:hypothetical protein